MKPNLDIEDRLRPHLGAQRVPPPSDLEHRVLRRLRAADAPTKPGLLRQLVLAAALVAFVALVSFGVVRLRGLTGQPSHHGPTPSASATVSPSPAPSALSSPRPATAAEFAAMVAAGNPGAERDLAIADCGTSSPGPGRDCFQALNAADAIVGTNAGYFHAARFGTGCWVYVYTDGAGWHYVDVRCAQAPGQLPRLDTDDLVHVSGCANVRSQPGLQAPIVRCLANGTAVHVSSGPVYTDGKLWWLLQGQGWMAHESLIG